MTIEETKKEFDELVLKTLPYGIGMANMIRTDLDIGKLWRWIESKLAEAKKDGIREAIMIVSNEAYDLEKSPAINFDKGDIHLRLHRIENKLEQKLKAE